jgi:hypothetical protein
MNLHFRSLFSGPDGSGDCTPSVGEPSVDTGHPRLTHVYLVVAFHVAKLRPGPAWILVCTPREGHRLY